MLFLLSILTLFSAGYNPVAPSSKANLTIDIHNIRSQKGTVYIALFKPDSGFPEGKPVEGKKADIKGNSAQTTFSLEPGEYAVAVFHDENSNGILDKRLFGIPKEPYGFSNNFRPRMSAPKFKDCQFSVDTPGKTISIKLE
ncbi:DUF2141 domain-containing protein [Spirosoma sp. HMF3257]|uniref:DUF2141 domain-containing protein n=1 Tax=Spirosoma telluris TaxID=2183553 RepID=A0A327NIX1_9BACT|nr:DUF2141 domain-containing protein [Spirosoma telluris]RAI74785.1 DUF2141 domain-containing protein [Spirosoma telluris]